MGENHGSPFRIAATDPPATGGFPVHEEDTTAEPLDRIDRMVRSSDIFLFIKGTPEQPMCGFSANTVAVMNHLGVSYRTFNVLADDAIRAAAKEYSSWPTFPQVYVRGEFVGGNDIVTDMFYSGELKRTIEGAAG
jgi:monothiol glutaredoxin